MGWRPGSWRLPSPRNPAGEIRLRDFIGIWAMPGSLERTRPATCGGSIQLPARRERALGLQPQPLFTVHFWGRGSKGSSAGVTARHGWVAVVNTLPGLGPAPPSVNHSCLWNKFMPGQPEQTAALKTPRGGGNRRHLPPLHHPHGGHPPGIHPTHSTAHILPNLFRDSPVPTNSPAHPFPHVS